MFKRFRHILKYIFLSGILCVGMTACGNVDGQSAVEQSEAEITQEPLEETQESSLEPTVESEPESMPEPEPELVPEQEQEEVIDNTQVTRKNFTG